MAEFEFIDAPTPEASEHALETLKVLEALDSEGKLIYFSKIFIKYTVKL